MQLKINFINIAHFSSLLRRCKNRVLASKSAIQQQQKKLHKLVEFNISMQDLSDIILNFSKYLSDCKKKRFPVKELHFCLPLKYLD